jgi:hypothetical protein
MFRIPRLLTALLAFTLLAANNVSAITIVSAEKTASGLFGAARTAHQHRCARKRRSRRGKIGVALRLRVRLPCCRKGALPAFRSPLTVEAALEMSKRLKPRFGA